MSNLESLQAPEIVYEDDYISVERREAEVDPSHVAPYLVTRPVSGELKPLIWEKGYGDSCDGKLPLIRAFASHGYATMAVGQSRRSDMRRDPKTGYPDAIVSQAAVTLAAIEAEQWQFGTLPVVGYSMGGTVAAAMVQEARQRGWRCFDKADIVLLASPGVINKDSPLALSTRGLYDAVAQQLRGVSIASSEISTEIFGQDGGDAASLIKVILENPAKAIRELSEVSNRRIHLVQLAQCVGQVSIGVLAKDGLVPMRRTDQAVAAVFDDPEAPSNISYFTPYSVDGRYSGHVDPLHHPTRIVAAVAQQLR